MSIEEQVNKVYSQLKSNRMLRKCGFWYEVEGEKANMTIDGDIPDHADLRTDGNLTLSGQGTLLGEGVQLPEKIGVSSYEDRGNEIKSPYGDGEEFRTSHFSHITVFPKGKMNGVKEVELQDSAAVYFPKGSEVPEGMKLTGKVKDYSVMYTRYMDATCMEISGHIPDGIDLSGFEEIELYHIKSIGKGVKFPKKVWVYGDLPHNADLRGVEDLRFSGLASNEPTWERNGMPIFMQTSGMTTRDVTILEAASFVQDNLHKKFEKAVSQNSDEGSEEVRADSKLTEDTENISNNP